MPHVKGRVNLYGLILATSLGVPQLHNLGNYTVGYRCRDASEGFDAPIPRLCNVVLLNHIRE